MSAMDVFTLESEWNESQDGFSAGYDFKTWLANEVIKLRKAISIESDESIPNDDYLNNQIAQLRQERDALRATIPERYRMFEQYGLCQDCGFPLDLTDNGDIVCHKCGEEIGDRTIAQQAAQLDQARQLLLDVTDVFGHDSSIDAWLAANAPQPERVSEAQR